MEEKTTEGGPERPPSLPARGDIMSQKPKRTTKKVRMTVSSTLARAGAVIERPEDEAKRLIAAGYAQPYDDGQEYATQAEVAELAERVAALEAAVAGKGNKDKQKEK